MTDEDHRLPVGHGYAGEQLVRAFITACTHEDPEVAERASGRVARWTAVLRGMAVGRLQIGSRTPVADWPAWVTLEVVRGGFATGAALAGGPLQPHEVEIARRTGVEPDARRGVEAVRRAAFAHHLTQAGVRELEAMLLNGAYAIRVPEEAAMLVVVGLVRAGATDAAVELVEELEPFADRLRFSPPPAEPDDRDLSVMCRQTVGETSAALSAKRRRPQVEAMHEALTVWNPFADEVLSHWLETVREGRVGEVVSPEWVERGAALVERHRTLAAAHTRCTKHRKPKENLAILLAALEETVEGRPLAARRLGLVQHAVDAMVARRGLPGSNVHAELRAAQAANASQPAHHAIARIVVGRLAELPPHHGVESIGSLVAPVQDEEAEAAALPAGTPIPRSIQKVVHRAITGTPERLVEEGVIPSAEVLAALVPRLAAATTAMAYGDERFGELMAAHYQAFRRRRSLLLLDLQHQVRIEELPWVRAAERLRRGGGAASSGPVAALSRLAELSIAAFPSTVMPNKLVTEVAALAEEAGLDLPLVEELAADIFAGSFSAKFLRAAQLAGQLLGDSLYERYYGIDYAGVIAIDDVARVRPGGPQTSAAFDALCRARAGDGAGAGTVAANGMVIEQAQILTTHNLAALTGPFGVGERVSLDRGRLADRCFETVISHAGRLDGAPHPLRRVKDIAYAWRQMVFFLAGEEEQAQAAFVRRIEERLLAQPGHVASMLGSAVHGLAHVVAGGAFDEGMTGDGRRVLGWTVGANWLLPDHAEVVP